MYELLYDISKRPEPFARYTAKALWTRPHLARQMLNFHLSQDTDLASRRCESIDRIVDWINNQIGLPGKNVCDLGCGPGLYAQRFESKGAHVTGVDFSAHSLDYAKIHSPETIHYIEADYLSDTLPTGFDLVTLIYTDFCALSPVQREKLLRRIHRMLNHGGRIILDVAGLGSYAKKEETTVIQNQLMDGFWAEGEYVGIQRTYLYQDKSLSLDHYLIVQPDDAWQIYNWIQHFTPNSLEAELSAAGFKVDQLVGDLSGTPFITDGNFIGVIASAI